MIYFHNKQRFVKWAPFWETKQLSSKISSKVLIIYWQLVDRPPALQGGKKTLSSQKSRFDSLFQSTVIENTNTNNTETTLSYK